MTTILRTGSKGPDVKKLQELLNTTLLLNPALKIDGDFGRATDAAVKRFQAERGLGIDGIVGPKTRRALDYKKLGSASYTPHIAPPSSRYSCGY